MTGHSKLFIPQGHLVLGFGPMGSGKSQYLRRELTRMADIGMRVLYICHSSDEIRDSSDGVTTDGFMTSHESSFSGLSSKIRKIRTPLLSSIKIDDYDAIGIDEGAFFQVKYDLDGDEAKYHNKNYISDIERTVTYWVEEMNKRVIVVSLAGDFRRKRFGYTTDLMPMANKVKWFNACCIDCLEELKLSGFRGDMINCHASFSARLTEDKSQNSVGTLKDYAPMCRNHIKEYNRLREFERVHTCPYVPSDCKNQVSELTQDKSLNSNISNAKSDVSSAEEDSSSDESLIVVQ